MRLRCADFAAIQGAVYVDTIASFSNILCQDRRQVCCFCKHLAVVQRSTCSIVSCPACAAASVNSVRNMQGYSKKQTIFLTPIMFGVAHLHHLLELVRFQGARLSSASAVVSLPKICSHEYALCTILISCSVQLACWFWTRRPSLRASLVFVV